MQTSELGIICNLVEQYCLRMEDTIKQFVNIVRNDYRIEETLDSLHPKPTTSFPSQYHQQQLQVLLFNNDTKQKFLRTALTPELFTNLKKISKLWLANVPEEQRKQATKVAQAIAKAITDGRVECITENDLATYKTRVIERLGREYHIPHEQICLAFTQKIRVYLQNTKSKHNKWIERYGLFFFFQFLRNFITNDLLFFK